MRALLVMMMFLIALPAAAQDWVPTSHKVVGLIHVRKHFGLIKAYKWEYKCEGTGFVLKKDKPIPDITDLRTERQKHPWLTLGRDILPGVMFLVGELI